MLVEYYIYFSSFKTYKCLGGREHSHLFGLQVGQLESQESLGLHLSQAVNGQTGIDRFL